ncbi:5030_t:CDS:1 [Funneliformis mosseae]|uniref:5030_t:CDS:1 n=1 Tax=Funneliformis mosseae TaxID=27381 RepID=A0A9N8ZQB6_FUNMO|nr:5030_t:CDS:1 [Funneliformis mosseae]
MKLFKENALISSSSFCMSARSRVNVRVKYTNYSNKSEDISEPLLIRSTKKKTDVYINLTNDNNENKKKPDGTTVLNNNVARRLVLVNDNENDIYTFVKAITLPLNNTNDIKETLYYRSEDPARKNFDQTKPRDKLGVGINYGVCWVYNWETINLKGMIRFPAIMIYGCVRTLLR